MNAFDFVRCDPDDPTEDATAVAGGRNKGNPFVACLQLLHADAVAITFRIGSPGSGVLDRESCIVGALLLQDTAALLSTDLTVHNYASTLSRQIQKDICFSIQYIRFRMCSIINQH